MLYVRPLTTAETDELKHMLRHAVGRVSQRAHLILLSAHHVAVPELARLFACSPATVRFWMRRFEVAGPDGLRDAPRAGRPRKITPVVKATLNDVLYQDPHRADASFLLRLSIRDGIANVEYQDPHRADASFLATCWTTAMLAMLCATRLHVTVCRTTVRNALQRLGLRWRRPRPRHAASA